MFNRLSDSSGKLFFLNLLAGASTTLAFQPFNVVPLVFVTFGILFYSLRETTPALAFKRAWAFSFGFHATGICWLFVSLHFYGGTPMPMAITMVLGMAAFLGLFTSSAIYYVKRYIHANETLYLVLLYPAAWTTLGWVQGFILTGFDWMQPGYTQVDWPLSGLATVAGNYGVGLAVLVSAALFLLSIQSEQHRLKSIVSVACLWLASYASSFVDWTEPVGEPLEVALVQANIPQDVKWQPRLKKPTLELYQQMTIEAGEVDLIVWPETAVPGYVHLLPRFLKQLRERMEQHKGELIFGIFIQDLKTGRYYNSVVNAEGGEYKKRHLVPFGEYIPFRIVFEFVRHWINIPLSDIAAADDNQPPLIAAGQKLGMSICFEDAFSRDVRIDLPEATLLVNVSNDAWFSGSHQSYQHHAIARMRALETGRYMLRSTNTGISSVINEKGKVVAAAENYKRQVLKSRAQPMKGSTPYVMWGDGFVLLLCAGLMILATYLVKKE